MLRDLSMALALTARVRSQRVPLASAALGVLLVASTACGEALAPESYRGEVIFRAQGIVQSASSLDSWHAVRPVVAFKTYKTQLQLVDSISVRPSDARGISGEFNLELYDVPPDETLIDFEGHPDWGKLAFGMIVAVAPDHPQHVDYLHTDWANFGCEPGESCPCAADEWPRKLDYSYGSDPSAQYHETICCPDPESEAERCKRVSTEGDARILDKPALPVAALVQDFLLLYLQRDAPAGSKFADYLFHASEGVSAGYHLLKVTQAMPDAVLDDDYKIEVVGTKDIALTFQRDVLPWGINL